MGRMPTFIVDNPQNCKTAITIQNKTYFIEDYDEEDCIGVRIFDKATINWVVPVALGTEPKRCKLGYSTVSLSDDRILVIKKGLSSDEEEEEEDEGSLWFLEVNTDYVNKQKEILKEEVVAWSRGVIITENEKPVVISGPCGASKGALMLMLMNEFPSKFVFSARAPRSVEKDVEEEKIVEFASVNGNVKGKRCIFDVDVEGAKLVRAASCFEAIFIFICPPPSKQEFKKRLETEEQNPEEEETEYGLLSSSGVFDHILYSDNLQECYKSLKKVLELDETTDNVAVEYHSVSKVDDKIIINCGTAAVEEESKSSIVLDALSLRGGAPDRTRISKDELSPHFHRLGCKDKCLDLYN